MILLNSQFTTGDSKESIKANLSDIIRNIDSSFVDCNRDSRFNVHLESKFDTAFELGYMKSNCDDELVNIILKSVMDSVCESIRRNIDNIDIDYIILSSDAYYWNLVIAYTK